MNFPNDAINHEYLLDSGDTTPKHSRSNSLNSSFSSDNSETADIIETRKAKL